MKLGEMSWKDFKDSKPKTAVVPTGSTEQHGPHAPLQTDTLIAEAMAEKATEETDTLLLPSINVGVSREHSSFPGTLSLSPDTFRSQLTETILSAHDSGVEKFVVVNGHGGNVRYIREVCENLYHDEGLLVLEWTWFDAINARGMGHAGELETSLLLYLEEDLLSEPGEPGDTSWGKKMHGAIFDYDTEFFTRDGVVGDPNEASTEKGEKIFEQSTEELSDLLKALISDKNDFSEAFFAE